MIPKSGDTTVATSMRPAQLVYTLIDNQEAVGVGLVPTAQARALVPAPLRLPDDHAPVTPLVVLATTARRMTIADGPPAPGAYALVGLLIASPDGTGVFNTLLLWHYTSNRHLARGLRRVGIAAQYVPQLELAVAREGNRGAVSLQLAHPARPALELAGTFSAPDQPLPAGFVANWWSRQERRLIKAATSVPAGAISAAQLGLRTDAGNALGEVIGGSQLDFAVLQRFNTFADARTEVTIRASDTVPA
jgi:hypothetical protein